MRYAYFIAAIAGTTIAAPALAADTLQFGPAPDWVIAKPVPPAAGKPSAAPIAILLSDEQIRLDPGQVTKFAHTAARIQTSEGLAAGNLSLSWNPATDILTVNRLEIRRGDKVIDVLKTGQKFTTMRRESNLEQAMLTGVLTANIQPEDLREGDILVLATTRVSADPVLKGHVESLFAGWNGAPIGHAFARLAFPASLPVQIRTTGGLPQLQPRAQGKDKVAEIDLTGIEPLILPKDAPMRFRIGRLGQATDFRDWSDIGKLFEPLYQSAAQIPAAGPLRDEVEKIRSRSADQKARAQAVLELAQNRVRYVALALGQGGYVPASAEETWARRFGDCKAKTALLMAMFKELGITSEAVAVSSRGGDAIAGQLPMIGLFDHVLVKAVIEGKTYWLDGTRTGDGDIDLIQVPDFGWGLPLNPSARLIKLEPAPLDRPNNETFVDIDSTGGVLSAATVTAREVLRGDGAVAMNNLVATFTEAQRKQFLEEYWKDQLDFVTPAATSVEFDPAKLALTIKMSGSGKLDWGRNSFWIPKSGLAFKADFERTSGLNRDAPIAIGFPGYRRRVTTIRMPPKFFVGSEAGKSPPIHETLAGIEYRRTFTVTGDLATVESSERSLVAEVPYNKALADQPRLRELDDLDLALTLPASYRLTRGDRDKSIADKPANLDERIMRGHALYVDGRYKDAIEEFTKVLAKEPTYVEVLAERSMAYIYDGQVELAAKDVAAASRLDATNDHVMQAQALLAERQGNADLAVATYDRLVAKKPDNAYFLSRRAEVERSLKRNEDALADSAKALELDSSLIDMRLLRANIFTSSGRNAEAEKEADALVADNPTGNYSYVVAGKIFGFLGLKDKAMAAFDKAIAAEPEAYIYINRAQIRPLADRAGRLADLDAALKLDPNSPEALSLRAVELGRAGRHGEAAATLLKILNSGEDPRISDRTDYAVALYKDGKQPQARPLVDAIEKDLKEPFDYNGFCWRLATAGIDLEKALSACREAVRLKPDRSGFIDSLAFVKLRLGKLVEALADYDRALALSPRNSSSLMGRAIVHARLGKASESAADLAKATEITPEISQRFAEYGLSL